MGLRPCLTCGTPTRSTRCKTCQAPVERAKWLRNPNRDPDYRKARDQVAKLLPVACSLCGHPIWHSGHDKQALTLDHIVPVSRGGTNDANNLRPAHRGCNSKRGNR